MANHTELLPLAPYADVEETIAAEASIRRARRIQSVVTGLRLAFPDFIEFHEKHRQHTINNDRTQFHSFARGFCGPGNLTIIQWYQAWDAWVKWEDARDERDTQVCALDVGVQ